jgi:hypothetical protein
MGAGMLSPQRFLTISAIRNFFIHGSSAERVLHVRDFHGMPAQMSQRVSHTDGIMTPSK